jgi:hypothetical protein
MTEDLKAGFSMAYVYAKVDDLEQTDLVGSHHCVALVQHYANAPQTVLWKKGEKVKDSKTVKKGTAIATFVKGKYLNNMHGNHAAFYMSKDEGGIWVMDQWKGDPKKSKVSKRYILFKGIWTDGSFVDPSNNADAFSVIE